jgi:hypothetical protein
MEIATGFSSLADKQGFAVVYPDGFENSRHPLQGLSKALSGLDISGFLVGRRGSELALVAQKGGSLRSDLRWKQKLEIQVG